MRLELGKNWQIEDLGVQDIDVYDIEVEENHNFFANDILVHNSTYFDISDVAKLHPDKSTEELVDILDNFCQEHIEAEIDTTFKKVFGMFSSMVPKLSMKREAIAKAVIVAKKRYVFYVFDNEGVRYAKPKLKVTGLETARSSTPPMAKQAMLDIYHMMFNNTESDVQKYIKKFLVKWGTLDPNEVAKVMSVNGIEKQNTQQSKAAMIYNDLINKKKLLGKYNLITNGQKVKILKLLLPNPVRLDNGKNAEFIAYLDKLPAEFNLDQYVDRGEIYEKVFLSAIVRVLEARGWSYKKINKVDGWMV